jgi:hypothetical protein
VKSQFEAAIIEEQGTKFAVVAVQSSIFNNASDVTMIIKALLPTFKGIPVVLMTIDDEEKPAYFGRPDLVILLENVNIKEAPWSQMEAEIDLGKSVSPINLEGK